MMRQSSNRHERKTAAIAFLLCLGAAWTVSTQDRAIINNGASPHSKLRSVDLSDVRWTGGFWNDRFELVKDVTIPKMWDYYNGDGNSHWTNFRIAAGLEKGKWSGTSWHDGDFYKWLEAVAHVYIVTRDPALDRRMDEAIEIIGKVQRPDGYISTRIILEKLERFQDIHHHELYNMGHLMTAACIHHRATGKANFLDVARKTGDYLYATFKGRSPELAHFGFNPSNIMGAVELYRTTGDRKYLDLANVFIDMRGSQPAGSRHYGLGGTDQTQDRVPLREETEAVGHAVTATYLYCGAADAYMETGDTTLLEALDRIWSDVVRRKLYVHGGVGPLTRGLSMRRDDVHEAFSDPYFLPNRKCYCETCSNIGNAMWNWRMLNITAEARYTDVMERVFYNSGISGLGLDGDHFFYSNVLRRLDPKVPLLRSDTPERWKHRRGYCCPPQLARTVAKMRGFAYSTSDDGLWVHLYESNELETELPDGTAVKLVQETDYPWDGNVKITLELAQVTAFTLRLRIPGWAAGTAAVALGQSDANPLDNLPSYIRKINDWGQRADFSHDGKRILFIEKTYGDTFELELATGKVTPVTHHYYHGGYTRALYLANGDILLSGCTDFVAENPHVNRYDKAELWVLDKSLTMPPVRLGAHCFEGPAVSRKNLRIAWTTEFRQYPDTYADGELRVYVADIVYDNGTPKLANQRLVLSNMTNEFFERPMSIETQNFVAPEETHITMSIYGAGTVAIVNLESGEIRRVSTIPNHHNEPEGIYPDEKYTLVESSRQFIGEKLRGPVQYIDIWKLSLDGNESWERITHFTDYEGYKSSNPVVSDDGRYIAFQMARRGDPAGVGRGLFLRDIEAMEAAKK